MVNVAWQCLASWPECEKDLKHDLLGRVHADAVS
jgi:hypothetical protein